jgi:hypothetical protein
MPDPTLHPNELQPRRTGSSTTSDADTADRCPPTRADRTAARDEAAAQFRYFAQHRAGTYAPLYARLAEAIADSPDLLDLALLARTGQSRPDLLLAVIHGLLLREPEYPTARFYPSLTDHPRPGDPAPDVLQFARAHHDEIAAAMRHRLVQTNEVGRCTFLAPAIRTAAALHMQARLRSGRVGLPLALLEVGASAGLNLLLDKYGYRYYPDLQSTAHQPIEVTGDPVLECMLDGPGVPPAEPLQISWRAGIDLNPLDVDDPDDQRWLRALVWPDHRDRAALLDSALQVAIRTAPRPTLHAGDAPRLLAHVAADAPVDAHLVIYHSAVLAHMTPSARERFTAAVLALSTERPVSWVQAEPRLDGDPRRLRLTECSDGRVLAEHALGSYQPHGRRLRWG